MNLKDFTFPEVTPADKVFPTFGTDKQLLSEAKKRGYYNGSTPHNKLFSKLFFKGGSVTFKKRINPEYKNRVWTYCRAFMGSWTPKHEEKEAICSLLMSEIIEP